MVSDIPCPEQDPRGFLMHLFRAALATADPMLVVPAYLPPRPKGRLVVIGAGKASARMAEAVESQMGPCEGLVITRYGYARPTKGIEIVEAAHPIPDAAGAAATARMLGLVSDLTADDLVLALISGGGSALLCAPADGITLEDKMAVNAALVASGAPISQINLLRKHLSRVKGGRLAAACAPASVVSLLISDVPGDDPAMIASGPTVGDHSQPAQARDILDRWSIPVAPAVSDLLNRSSAVVAPGDPRLARAQTHLIAAPSAALAEMAQLAQTVGVTVRSEGDALEGEAAALGLRQANEALKLQKKMQPGAPPILLISGGECTVTLGDHKGMGGPNAEFVLAAVHALQGAAGIHVLAGDSDGVDGAADIAGAVGGPDTLRRAAQLGISSDEALMRHDAHRFFAALGDQVITGPTLTNVNDIRAILILPPGPAVLR